MVMGCLPDRILYLPRPPTHPLARAWELILLYCINGREASGHGEECKYFLVN